MPERRNLWNKKQKKSCWKSWKKWQKSHLMRLTTCKVMRCYAVLWQRCATLLHKRHKPAPTTGKNWRRAENKNNSASGYGVLLSKNQHLSDQVLFLYPNHERTDSNGRRNRQPEHAAGRYTAAVYWLRQDRGHDPQRHPAAGIRNSGGLLQAAGHERWGTPDRCAGFQDQACHTGKGNQLPERPAGDRPAESTGTGKWHSQQGKRHCRRSGRRPQVAAVPAPYGRPDQCRRQQGCDLRREHQEGSRKERHRWCSSALCKAERFNRCYRWRCSR